MRRELERDPIGKPPLVVTVVLPTYGVQDAIASVVRDRFAAHSIELGALQLGCDGHAEPPKEVGTSWGSL